MDVLGNKGQFEVHNNFSIVVLANGDRLDELQKHLNLNFKYF